MSVCSSTAAASSRPSCRRESRSLNTRASCSEPQFFIDRSGHRIIENRKYSTVSTTKQSSGSTWCCVISIVMTIFLIGQFGVAVDSLVKRADQ